MNRGDFEARMLRDPQFRKNMEAVEKAAKRVRRAQEELVMMSGIRDHGIAWLAGEGVPLATLARLVDLTPQRLGVIVREVGERVDKMDEAMLAEALHELEAS